MTRRLDNFADSLRVLRIRKRVDRKHSKLIVAEIICCQLNDRRKRVVIEAGLALPSSANLPFSKFDRADLTTFKDGTGDIELSLTGPRLLYSMLWPNVRWLRVNRTTPILRAIEEPQKVAKILTDALATDQSSEAAAKAEAQEPEPEMRRSVAS